MDLEEVVTVVVDSAVRIHREVGPGLLESAYERMLQIELAEHGLLVQRQIYLDLAFRGHTIERAYCVDMLVNGCIIVEIKSTERVAPVHLKQLLTYLRLMHLRVGLLLNFGQTTLKEGGIHRVVNGWRFGAEREGLFVPS